jgi:hypothetical protein
MASGLVALVFAGPISDFMEIPMFVLIIVGIGVIVFGVAILVNARREQVNLTEAWVTVIADDTWVTAALVIIFGFPDSISDGGRVLFGAISVVVAVFGFLQFVGIRRVTAPETVAASSDG